MLNAVIHNFLRNDELHVVNVFVAGVVESTCIEDRIADCNSYGLAVISLAELNSEYCVGGIGVNSHAVLEVAAALSVAVSTVVCNTLSIEFVHHVEVVVFILTVAGLYSISYRRC